MSRLTLLPFFISNSELTQLSKHKPKQASRHFGPIIGLALIVALAGCDNSNSDTVSNQEAQEQSTSVHQENSNLTDIVTDNVSTDDDDLSVINKDIDSAVTDIDWTQIDSGVAPADTTNYDYPIAINSGAVKAHADYHSMTPQQAQHSLIIGTASNEPLMALFDQLGDRYVTHQLSDGPNTKLIIYTTDTVVPSEYDYVIAGDFGRGLILPIEVRPQPAITNEPIVDSPLDSEAQATTE